MASALVHGLIRAGVAKPQCITAADPLESARQSLANAAAIQTTESNQTVVDQSDVVVLAVKPQSMPDVLLQIKPNVSSRHLIISIAAGVTSESIAARLDGHQRIIRVMPNTPALLGAGAAGYSLAQGASNDDEALVRSCLNSVGVCHRLPEPLLDAVTGLAGSGPAFVYIFIESLADGGVRAGLPRDVALSLAAQTVLGAARMVLESNDHPAALKDRVASPAGTTIAGIQSLERAGFRSAVIDAVAAAANRSIELGKHA
jgi:pyrroline-5-carboxylate reductase